jgi:hypothetical protein
MVEQAQPPASLPTVGTILLLHRVYLWIRQLDDEWK